MPRKYRRYNSLSCGQQQLMAEAPLKHILYRVMEMKYFSYVTGEDD